MTRLLVFVESQPVRRNEQAVGQLDLGEVVTLQAALMEAPSSANVRVAVICRKMSAVTGPHAKAGRAGRAEAPPSRWQTFSQICARRLTEVTRAAGHVLRVLRAPHLVVSEQPPLDGVPR